MRSGSGPGSGRHRRSTSAASSGRTKPFSEDSTSIATTSHQWPQPASSPSHIGRYTSPGLRLHTGVRQMAFATTAVGLLVQAKSERRPRQRTPLRRTHPSHAIKKRRFQYVQLTPRFLPGTTACKAPSAPRPVDSADRCDIWPGGLYHHASRRPPSITNRRGRRSIQCSAVHCGYSRDTRGRTSRQRHSSNAISPSVVVRSRLPIFPSVHPDHPGRRHPAQAEQAQEVRRDHDAVRLGAGPAAPVLQLVE